MQAVNRNPTPRELRRFGLVTLGGFAALGLLVGWVLPWLGGRLPAWGFSGTTGEWTAVALWSIGLAFALVGTAAPGPARRLYVAWMTAAVYLGTVTSFILLSVLFFILLPVFSLIRLKDPLRRRWNRSGTYWEPHKPHEPTLERMMRPF